MSKEKLVRYKSAPLTEEQVGRLTALAELPDEQIDFSDMPELGEDFFDNAVRGDFYHPVKRQTTLRLDADILDWFKHQSNPDGSSKGYQTRINLALRAYVAAQQRRTKRVG